MGKWLLLVVTLLAGCPSPAEEFEPTGDGCMLSASLGGAATNGGMFFPSGDYALDAFYQNEGVALVNAFSVSPRGFYFIDGYSPNAFATSQVVNAYGPDGTVLFGVTLLQQELARDGQGLSVRAIMAHEFTHLVQFKRGTSMPGKHPELQGDYMAGWYSAQRGVSMAQLEPILMSFFSKGDYEFNSAAHHGTPTERINSVRAGYASGSTSFEQAWTASLQYLAANP
jgi:hypothetical protein